MKASGVRLEMSKKFDILRHERKQLFQMTVSEMASLRKEKELLCSQMDEQRQRFCQKQEETQEMLVTEREKMNEELKAEEQMFQERFLHQEATLKNQAASLRQEIAEWASLKEDICQKQQQLEQLHQHLMDRAQSQKKEQEWLSHKQKVQQLRLGCTCEGCFIEGGEDRYGRE